jgi:hypothetical protein
VTTRCGCSDTPRTRCSSPIGSTRCSAGDRPANNDRADGKPCSGQRFRPGRGQPVRGVGVVNRFRRRVAPARCGLRRCHRRRRRRRAGTALGRRPSGPAPGPAARLTTPVPWQAASRRPGSVAIVVEQPKRRLGGVPFDHDSAGTRRRGGWARGLADRRRCGDLRPARGDRVRAGAGDGRAPPERCGSPRPSCGVVTLSTAGRQARRSKPSGGPSACV